jgi:hypothetical protein
MRLNGVSKKSLFLQIIVHLELINKALYVNKSFSLLSFTTVGLHSNGTFLLGNTFKKRAKNVRKFSHEDYLL